MRRNITIFEGLKKANKWIPSFLVTMDFHLTLIINFPLPFSQACTEAHKVFSGYINMIVKATDVEDNQGINLLNSFSYILRYVKLPQSN